MEYKVGDRVKVISVEDEFWDILIGKEFIIDDIREASFMGELPIGSLKEEDLEHYFSEDQLQLVEEIEKATESEGGALRYNKGKPQFSHLSPDFILEMMKGMTKANEKYPYLNYAKAQDVRTAADSLMRHFLKFQQGDDIDQELDTHHLALVAVNAMIMYQNLMDFGDEVDNRYSKEKDKVQGLT